MKRIGLIGGLGPEATIDYYKTIIDIFKENSTSLEYPEIIIYSVNMSDFLELMKRKEYEKVTMYLLEKIDALKAAGADFAALTANTPHLLFERLQAKTNLPLVSIVEATARETLKKGFKRPGLLGTGFTMNAPFYPDVFQKYNLQVIMPEPQDREIINQKLFSEIELGIFKDETRRLLIDIIQKMVEEHQIDSIILGCTEFPLILSEPEYCGIPVLNTTLIHVKEIIEMTVNTR
ncbi:MAG TPA: amino acid racemase [Draconibacterium sp.]|nr:amino acid racemase [Draconibacterium sp.]